jgi:hypothetical protein
MVLEPLCCLPLKVSCSSAPRLGGKVPLFALCRPINCFDRADCVEVGCSAHILTCSRACGSYSTSLLPLQALCLPNLALQAALHTMSEASGSVYDFKALQMPRVAIAQGLWCWQTSMISVATRHFSCDCFSPGPKLSATGWFHATTGVDRWALHLSLIDVCLPGVTNLSGLSYHEGPLPTNCGTSSAMTQSPLDSQLKKTMGQVVICTE